jgi:hypothetical protein
MTFKKLVTAIYTMQNRWAGMANRTVTFADPPATANYVSASVLVSWLNPEMMDAAFVKVVASEANPGGLSYTSKTAFRWANTGRTNTS